MAVSDTALAGRLAGSGGIGGGMRAGGRGDAVKRKRFAVCAGLLALLMLWAVIFPQTGDGDAIMHYLNARDGLWQPAKLMGSWARVGAKIPLLIPAQFGILWARWMSALVSVLCAWQTIRLADDLKMSRAILAAPMLIFQPFVFTLAGDTMTELPLALGLVIGIRLWCANRFLASCLVIGYLPTVRPEGFFLCAVWGGMVLAHANIGPLKRRLIFAAAIGWGALAWLVACWIIRNEPTYFFRAGWSWPPDSQPSYGHGPFFSHINRWPTYCGPILLPLFLVGLWDFGRPNRKIFYAAITLLVLELIVPAMIRERILPWLALALAGAFAWSIRRRPFALGVSILLMIFTLHSVLWWRGWFGSCGLMRILACVAPLTAILCLRGWNVLTNWIPRFRVALAALGFVAMAVTPMVYYVLEPVHHRIFPLERACEFVRERGLLAGAPMIILGDPMAETCLNMRPNPPNLMEHFCDRTKECQRMLSAPIGAVGFWDNQHARAWFGVYLSDLPTLGYDVLFTVRHRSPMTVEWMQPANEPMEQVYVVIRKSRPGSLPGDVSLGK